MAGNATKDDYVFSTFRLTADIEGIGEVQDIVAISATFALNTIPKASLTLASGINATTQQPATAHKVLANVKLRAKVKVFLEIKTTDGKISKSPQQKLKVFDGYYAGFGFQRAQDNAQYTMHLVHWLDDLNTASMLSRNFFPGAPFATDQAANNFTMAPVSGLAMPIPSFDPQHEFIKYENITSDFWEKVLKPILKRVAEWPRPGEDNCGADPPQGDNAVLNALERINGGPNKAELKLAIDDAVSSISGADVVAAIDLGLAQQSLEGYNYSTTWGALVGLWGPSFFFALSPSVDYANVFPYFGGLKFDEGDKNFKTIDADDYGYANFMCNTGTILEGIDIFWGQQSTTHIVSGGPAPVTLTNFCVPLGQYPNVNERDKRGSVLVKEPPGWLSNFVVYTGAPALESAGLATQVSGDATTGMNKGTVVRGDAGPSRPEAQAGLKNSGLANRLAEQWYKTDLLQQRYGEFSGKLRFDIAPGSIVKLKAPHRSMPTLADSKTDMIGMVAQVSFVINAELAHAGTAFSLTNLRSDTEDKNPLITRDMPPLYQSKWGGGPLATP